MNTPFHWRAPGRLLTKLLVGLVLLIAIVVQMYWLGGGFERKITADRSGAVSGETPRPAATITPDTPTAVVRERTVPRIETAVGTVRSVREISVASKLLAKVVEINASAGMQVHEGDVLVRLDDADLVARLEQAEAVARAAQALRDQAKIELDRITTLSGQGAASKIELDRVSSAYASARAEAERAEQAVAEARTVLGYATIPAPMAGVIIDKRVEVGDTVTPGQVLLTLFDPTRMQLVASVRESLTHRLRVGAPIGVRVDTIAHTCEGLVSEIVPEAESASRTFSVKVTGPCPPGVYSGMFGRLLIPLEDETVCVVPNSAIRRVGQLELVEVVVDGQARRRGVKLGRSFDDEVEVLAGLRPGETVILQPPASEPQP